MTINDVDPLDGRKGERLDDKNLINEWNTYMENKQLKHKYLWNKTDFDSLKPNEYEHVLGLFKKINL